MLLTDSATSDQNDHGFSDKQFAIILVVGQHLMNLLGFNTNFCYSNDNDDGLTLYFYRFESTIEQCRSDAFINLTPEGFLASVMALAGVLGTVKENDHEMASVADFLVYLDARAEESPLYDYIFKEIRSICFDVMQEDMVNEILEKINAIREVESHLLH